DGGEVHELEFQVGVLGPLGRDILHLVREPLGRVALEEGDADGRTVVPEGAPLRDRVGGGGEGESGTRDARKPGPQGEGGTRPAREDVGGARAPTLARHRGLDRRGRPSLRPSPASGGPFLGSHLRLGLSFLSWSIASLIARRLSTRTLSSSSV